MAGHIPFLDVKHAQGNTFFIQGSRKLEKYYGHHRPRDWFEQIKMNIVDVEKNQQAKNFFYALDLVRIEIPVLYDNKSAKLIKAINSQDQKTVTREAVKKFKINNSVDLMFIPAPTNKTRKGIAGKIGSIRILVHDKYVNKGVGLKKLANLVKVPESNIVYFGDSAADKANDIIVKKVLPKATLIITDNGEDKAKKYADFIVEPVSKDGVPRAVNKLTKFQKKYSKIIFRSG